MATPTTKVVFALDYVTDDGKEHKGGSTVAVDSHEARALLLKGVCREATAADDKDPVPGADDKKGGK